MKGLKGIQSFKWSAPISISRCFQTLLRDRRFEMSHRSHLHHTVTYVTSSHVWFIATFLLVPPCSRLAVVFLTKSHFLILRSPSQCYLLDSLFSLWHQQIVTPVLHSCYVHSNHTWRLSSIGTGPLSRCLRQCPRHCLRRCLQPRRQWRRRTSRSSKKIKYVCWNCWTYTMNIMNPFRRFKDHYWWYLME